MKHSKAPGIILLILLMIPAHSLSGDTDNTSFTRSEKQLRSLIVSITQKAAEYWLDNGRKETVKMLNTSGGLFDHGEIFVFACDMKGKLIAHRGKKKNPCRYTLSTTDRTGNLFEKKLISLTRTVESAWFTCYRFDKKSKKQVKRNLFILKKGTIIFCCSYSAP